MSVYREVTRSIKKTFVFIILKQKSAGIIPGKFIPLVNVKFMTAKFHFKSTVTEDIEMTQWTLKKKFCACDTLACVSIDNNNNPYT